ncbi:TPA: response regulator transcription factor, partial [Clostridioides difficile]
MAKILIVEDEKRMQSIIVEYMQKGGYTCITADDGVEALTILKSNNIDLMILDIMMPYLDGFSVCRVSREMTNIPIIILTAKGEEEDKLKGYEYGADDYITKPFSPKVLLAKVNALLRRYTTDIPKNSLSLGKIFIMVASRQVYVEDKLIDLTYKEFELLRLFMENPNQVF